MREDDRSDIDRGVRGGEPNSPWDVLRQRDDGPGLALAYASVFWPELVDIEGLVLIKENYDPEYLARVRSECVASEVEATINTTYLQDVVGMGEADVDEATWTALGEAMRDCWQARAQAVFPDREFVATFEWYSDGGDPGVCLQQGNRRDRRSRSSEVAK